MTEPYWEPLAAAPNPFVTYGLTFPVAPVDGQEHLYPAGGNGEIWRFRYNAGSASAYKWEFVGGSEVVISQSGSIGTGSMTNSGGWYSDPGMQLAMARAGDYVFFASMNVAMSAAGALSIAVGTISPGVAVPSPISFRHDTYLTTGYDFLHLRGKASGVAAGSSYRSFCAGAISNFNERHIGVYPIRVA